MLMGFSLYLIFLLFSCCFLYFVFGLCVQCNQYNMSWGISFLVQPIGIMCASCISIVMSFLNLGMFYFMFLLKIWSITLNLISLPLSIPIILGFTLFILYHIFLLFQCIYQMYSLFQYSNSAISSSTPNIQYSNGHALIIMIFHVFSSWVSEFFNSFLFST